jgi:uncharacterized protein
VLRAFLLPIGLFAAALAGCGSGAAAANDNKPLPALTGRVVDGADLLPPKDEARLADRLAALEKSTSDQLVVVTLPSLDGEPIEAFALRAGRGWGIGRKGVNNGVLLIVAPLEKRVRIEVGSGLEGLLTDEKAWFIIRDQILPRFQQGAYEQGIDAGVNRLIQLLEQDKRRPQPWPKEKAA